MATSAADAPLTVSTDGTAGPYVVVTSEQLGPVVEALRTEGVRFQVDQEAVLLNGAAALAVIDLGMGADVTRVQGVLDRVAAELQRKGRRGHRAPTRKELIIRGDAAAMRELRGRIETGSHGGWERRAEVEDRFRQTLPPRTVAFCFSKLVPAVNRQVAVLMRGRGPGMWEELHLSGIVPLTGRGQLDLAQHDQVVTDFQETFVKPLARDLGVRVLDRSVSTNRRWRRCSRRRPWRGSAPSRLQPTRTPFTNSTCGGGPASSDRPTSTTRWSIRTCWTHGSRMRGSRQINVRR